MADTLAPRAVIGVMTPAMNTVVQPELELLRPAGVTNQMQRFRLGGDAISDDLPDEAAKLMDCAPQAIAVGLTTDAGPGGPDKLAARCVEISAQVGVPVLGASQADYAGLRALGAARVPASVSAAAASASAASLARRRLRSRAVFSRTATASVRYSAAAVRPSAAWAVFLNWASARS